MSRGSLQGLPKRGRQAAYALPLTALVAAALAPAFAQYGPPPVTTSTAVERPVTQTRQYTGRVQAVDSVALIPRVTAYLDQRFFNEGSEVHKGDLLYRLEQGPFQANVLVDEGALAQAKANTTNAGIQFQRQKNLQNSPAFAKENFDNAAASARGNVGALLTAQGNLQYAQIQLGYTEIRAPIDGRITATSVNQGNVVSPTSGALATIVSQDPMYVVFPVATRDLLGMESDFASQGGLAAAGTKFTLPDGKTYDQTGKIDYVAPTVSTNTDTVTLRATVSNPMQGGAGGAASAGLGARALFDGEFVTVTVADPKPQTRLVIPRSAVLSDQQGNYVYGIGPKNVATRIDVTLGDDDGTDVVVTKGLSAGETFISDGIVRVHLGQPVNPKPAQAAASGGAQGHG